MIVKATQFEEKGLSFRSTMLSAPRLPLLLAACFLALSGSTCFGRKWTDQTGTYSVEAEFVAQKEGKVCLRKTDGKVIVVPLSKLSDDDRKYVASLAAAKPVEEASKPEPPRQVTAEERKQAIARLEEREWEFDETPMEFGGEPLVTATNYPGDATSEDLKLLHVLDHIRCLYLPKDTSASDDDLAYVGKMTGLRSLSLMGENFTDEGLKHLKGLQQLERLHLRGTRIHGHGLAHLEGLKKLRKLGLGEETTDEGLQGLKGLAGLTVLTARDTKIRGPGLKNLTGLTRLEELELENTEISGPGLEHLRDLPHLRELDLEHTPIDDEGLEYLQDQKSVQKLTSRQQKSRVPV